MRRIITQGTPLRTSLLYIALLGGCRCQPAEAPATTHVPGMEPLTAAVARNDAPAIAQYADNLVGSDEEQDGGAGERIGAATGMLRVSLDGEERADALASLAAGCGRCHDARDVLARHPSRSGHAAAAGTALDALVWGHTAELPAGAPESVAQVWGEHTEPQMRAAAVLRACQTCHEAPGERADTGAQRVPGGVR